MVKKLNFWDHLEDLRIRVINIVITIATISLFCFMFGLKQYSIFGFQIWLPLEEYRLFGQSMLLPAFEFKDNIASMVFSIIRDDLIPSHIKLIMVKPVDAIMANVQISLFLGVLIGMPIIVQQIGKFIFPALYTHEKRIFLRTIAPATFLFIFGALFAYYLMIPFFIDFLYGYGIAMEAQTFLSINEFISFVLILMLGFGLIFELPVFMAALTFFGVVKPEFWKTHWRIAVVIMIIIGGFITPDASGITQMMVAVPMMILYTIGYFISGHIYKKKEKAKLEEEKQE